MIISFAGYNRVDKLLPKIHCIFKCLVYDVTILKKYLKFLHTGPPKEAFNLLNE